MGAQGEAGKTQLQPNFFFIQNQIVFLEQKKEMPSAVMGRYFTGYCKSSVATWRKDERTICCCCVAQNL